MDLRLERLPKDGAAFKCGRRVAWGEGRDGDDVCRKTATMAIPMAYWLEHGDAWAFRAVCSLHAPKGK